MSEVMHGSVAVLDRASRVRSGLLDPLPLLNPRAHLFPMDSFVGFCELSSRPVSRVNSDIAFKQKGRNAEDIPCAGSIRGHNPAPLLVLMWQRQSPCVGPQVLSQRGAGAGSRTRTPAWFPQP